MTPRREEAFSAAAPDGELRLTEWTSCGGCAAKWGPAQLADLVGHLPPGTSGLLVGLTPSDDAAVHRIDEHLALVSTTDFFPPLVDDPADFGAIAAANACSDVFAMGGQVVLALNIAAFPERLPTAAVSAILAAAAEVVCAAGGSIGGGHTIRSDEPIFGLAVQGFVHPDRIWTKGGSRPGDVVVLSKPLGTGLVLAGGTPGQVRSAIAGMRTLNRDAAAALAAGAEGPHAVTDVTGFGLLGHGWEVAERSGVHLDLDGSALPAYDGALAAAGAGTRTGGDARNRVHLQPHVNSSVSAEVEALGYDPQTSGGLLATVTDHEAQRLVVDHGFTAIGRVRGGPPGITLA